MPALASLGCARVGADNRRHRFCKVLPRGFTERSCGFRIFHFSSEWGQLGFHSSAALGYELFSFLLLQSPRGMNRAFSTEVAQ